MSLEPPKIDPNMTMEQAILYYLFIDDQLLCAWWDYLDYWNDYKLIDDTAYDDPEFVKKQRAIMDVVDYWEAILDQLKLIVSYQDIEDYLRENPHVARNYLFVKK